jgi:hypothetical protein
MVQSDLIHHEHLFFTETGAPIPDVKYPYARWQRTLRRLAIRYRKPYMARHTSVSWSLMVGRNPLLVAKEHGHRITTMLSVYAAWIEGAVETDVAAIRDAMNRTDDRERHLVPKSGRDAVTNSPARSRIEGPRPSDRRRFDVSEDDRTNEIRYGNRFASGGVRPFLKTLKNQENFGGKGGTRTLDPPLWIQQLADIAQILAPSDPLESPDLPPDSPPGLALREPLLGPFGGATGHETIPRSAPSDAASAGPRERAKVPDYVRSRGSESPADSDLPNGSPAASD